MIAVVDYGVGNLHSVTKALQRAGADARVTTDAKEVGRARGVVFPGVGAFKDSMDALHRADLGRAVIAAVASGKPFLGICVGLQMLFEESEEFGVSRGLGVLKGRVVRFRGVPKVPHLGWNQIRIRKPGNPLLAGVPDGSHVYFVHSYYGAPTEDVVAATCDYGGEFAAMVWKDNVFATQFHPEKSQAVGLRILSNFKDLVGTEQG
jgi:glutamine amidotransferase